eukprot:TRINITY_DN16784_c0_g1_i1.p1 TRINITY_DN16784_c0_g1~~TRINITY_DN16784_c0_g1_i1.p1  ORF type:complete len:412 (-),score=104.53 TRINITY_DN16784_c0_g1_i1:91-1326(-)
MSSFVNEGEYRDSIEQMRVLKLQVKILKDTLKETTAELEEWKDRSFQAVKVQHIQDATDVFQTGEYKELYQKAERLSTENEELKSKVATYEESIENAKKHERSVMQQLEQQRDQVLKDLLERERQTEVKIKSQHAKLAKERKEMEEKFKDYKLLKEDRKHQQKQNELIREAANEVALQNCQLQEKLEEVEEQLSDARLMPDRITTEKDKEFQKRNGLNERQVPIEYYVSRYEGSGGYVTVTPDYVVFEHTSLLTRTITSVVISVRDIVSMNKCKANSLMPGHGHSVEIVTQAGSAPNKAYMFNSLMKRKEFCNLIVRQGVAVGVDIQTFRDGNPCEFDMSPSANPQSVTGDPQRRSVNLNRSTASLPPHEDPDRAGRLMASTNSLNAHSEPGDSYRVDTTLDSDEEGLVLL